MSRDRALSHTTRATINKGRRERAHKRQKEAAKVSKENRRIRILEERREELLVENRELQAKVARIPSLERRVAELEGGYRLGLREEDDRVQAVIARGLVIVWEGKRRRSLRPRDMRRARRVLASFRKMDP